MSTTLVSSGSEDPVHRREILNCRKPAARLYGKKRRRPPEVVFLYELYKVKLILTIHL